MISTWVMGLSSKQFARLGATVLVAVVTLLGILPGNTVLHAAAVDPSVEIIGVLAQPFCASTDGQLLSQIGTTTSPASFRMEFFAPGFGEVYNVVLNFSVSGNQNFTGFSVSPYSLAPNTPFTIRTTTYDAPNGAGNVSFISEIVFNCTTGAVISLTNTEASGVAGGCVNPDSRLNSQCKQPEQSVAVYCEAGNIVVFAVNDGKGYLAFKVTPTELASFSANPARNTLIKQKLGARLYKLTSGEYQVNRVKPDGSQYTFIFKGCKTA